MPTAMKNSPSNNPLNGSMSVSSSRRYSLSASSTPAKNAPNAIDRPTVSIRPAMPTTSKSDAAVKISGVPLLAIQRSTGRSSSRPPKMMPPITAMILIASKAVFVWTNPSFDAETSPRSGNRAKIGMAATSWNNKMENPACPLDVGIRLRSPMACSAIAVDDSASPRPATSATCQRTPNSSAAVVMSAVQASTWTLPQPKIGRRRAHRRLGSSSSPTKNSMSTTPNSAKCKMSCTLRTSPKPQGPIAMPAAK